MWPKCMPKGLTQKWSARSGSRAVMWPATPSSKPNLEKRRKAAARRCLRWSRSSAGSSNVILAGSCMISGTVTSSSPSQRSVPGAVPILRTVVGPQRRKLTLGGQTTAQLSR